MIELQNGQKVNAVPASLDELNSAKNQLEALGKSTGQCECGEELCIDGFIWACSLDNDNKCKWFKSDWQCNP